MKDKKEPNQELEQMQSKLDEYTNMLKHLQADFENYTKRVQKEKSEFSQYASYKVLSRIVNIVDDFEKALETLQTTYTKEQLEGLSIIYKQLHKVLVEEGVKPIESLGNKFDPFKHEVMDIIEGDEDNIVVNELQKGYIMHDKILRPSKVSISKKKEEQ